MTTPTDNTGLTGQQMQAMQKRMAEVLQGIRDSVELRKECLNMAIRAMPANATGEELMNLAHNMFGFLTTETLDVHVSINPP